jgi:gingipain R
MRKLLLFLFAGTLISITAGNNFRIIHSDAHSITLEYTFSGFTTKQENINGKPYFQVQGEHAVPVLNTGYPQVLRSSVSLALPENCSPKLEIVAADFITLNGVIAPSKGSLTRNINPKDVPYTFGQAYNENKFYPATEASFNDAYMLRSQKGISLSVYPIQNNPVTESIRVYNKIIMKISYVNAKGKKLNLNLPAFTSKEEKEILSQRFINLQRNMSQFKIAYTPLNEFGSMLVISAPTLSSAIMPLVNWKNEKGIKTTLVTTASSGTTGASVKAYIQNFYNSNPDLLYVLLVGDHQNINAFNAGTAGSETKWSDSKYGMLVGTDNYPEVMVGRFSSTSAADISTMVNRTLEYEKNPLAGNWYEKAIGIGSDEGAGIGDESEADWQHLRNIGNKLLADGYVQYHEFYDGSQGGNDLPGNPTASMVASAVNAGASLFFYTGHGDQNSCVTSNYSSADILAATNNGMYPFSLQVACNNGTFHNGTCLSETFTRAKNSSGPLGAIASCGSTILMAWAEPMDTQDEIGDIISNQYTNLKKFTLGGLFYCAQMHMLDMYPTNTGKEVMETWLMFGDPSCMIRTKNPTANTVAHDNCISPGSTQFTLNMNTGSVSYASLSQNGQIIGSNEITGSNQMITLTNTFSASQDLLLTVTGFNKIPYTSTVTSCLMTEISELHSYNLVTVNTVFSEELTLNYSTVHNGLLIELTDIQGKKIKTLYAEARAERTDIATGDLAHGVYILKITDTANHTVKVCKVIRQ